MFSRSLVHTLIQRHLAAMLLLLVALGAQAQSLDVNLVNNAGLMNLKSPEAQVFSTGQPTQVPLG